MDQKGRSKAKITQALHKRYINSLKISTEKYNLTTRGNDAHELLSKDMQYEEITGHMHIF